MRRPNPSPHRLAVGVATALVLAGVWRIVLADPIAPKARDHEIAITVTSKLKSEHISKHPLDDEYARRAVLRFVKTLDPAKGYFYQSDVDAFLERSRQVENAKKGDISLDPSDPQLRDRLGKGPAYYGDRRFLRKVPGFPFRNIPPSKDDDTPAGAVDEERDHRVIIRRLRYFKMLELCRSALTGSVFRRPGVRYT